ncbi:hypothetical protein FD30_GL001187 [Levilactobacillus namurensis DSM 19117]|uniref:Uncharacterized protein n=2 Tax=Levilactobacillus namurensis TaxID=380393 RepID=A0A0R1KBB1_9LACO|nr:hypothetical protein FD30_GL001187 [Levilactobacillus namurensis DSM 19117]
MILLSLPMTLIAGLHGTSPFRVFHWLFRENPGIAIIFIAGVLLYLLYRYNNRR